MQTEEIKKLVISALEDLKAKDITVIDVRGRSSVTDYMILATGTSKKHAQAVCDNASTEAKAKGLQPLGAEGRDSSDWMLLDLGDVIVHVMTEQARHFYDLERLWGEPSDEQSTSQGAQHAE
ncbi:MAG: ribosome silencing factor [Oleispira sp.]|nr:ribosome silencing factor [Oleispira sp.]MBL4798319.1 ribosome silencing factor [Oleispira sp.]MBL4881076.1 ribosome silencing factor [Oleispira sp.]